MRIVKKSADRQSQRQAVWLLLAVAVFAAGIFLGSSGTIAKIREAWQKTQNHWTSWSPTANLPVVTVDMAFADYNNLLSQRETALQEGVLFPRESAFVNAEVRNQAGAIPVRMRLQPGISEHLGSGEKWNYEVVARNSATLSGVTHANLIDPADNNGLNEWAFRQALRRENVLAGDYQFVNLIINGDERGTYALQEAVGTVAALGDQGTSAVVVGYDTEPLLESAARFGDVGSMTGDPITNLATSDLRFLPISDIRDPLITEDPVLAPQAQRATGLLRGLQRGELSASQVFDVEKYGRFLALVDLWGASGALSPFNLHYVYNSESDRLEPVALNGTAVQEDYRVPSQAMYHDPAIQTAYAAAAAKYSDPAYLVDLRAAIEADYLNLATLEGAGFDRELLWNMLAERQTLLRRSLQPTQPVIAQLGSPALAQDAIIQVNVASTLNLPLEILGFDIDGATFMETDPAWIVNGQPYAEVDGDRVLLKPAAGDSGGGLRYVTFNIPVTEIIARDNELDFLNEIQVRVATQVPGLEEAQLTVASPGLLDGE